MAISNLMKKQGEKTREAILKTGLTLWPNVTPTSIANALGINHGTVLHHFDNVKRAVAEYALETDCSPVIVQMLASNNPLVKDMPAEERLRHFKAI